MLRQFTLQMVFLKTSAKRLKNESRTVFSLFIDPDSRMRS